MAEILLHPNSDDEEKPFDFPDGSSILIKGGDHAVTVAEAIYMLEDVKYRIQKMIHGD